MPGQAVALLVHQNIFQVNGLIGLLKNDFDIYVHVDKKSGIDPQDIATDKVWKEIRVNWGGYSMIAATVFLYKKILASGITYSHVILLSGDSLPVKPNSYISDFLSRHNGLSFIENKPANRMVLDRRRFFWFKEDLRKRKSFTAKLLTPARWTRWLQKHLGITRGVEGFDRVGSQWTILALEHVKHLLEHCPLHEYRFMAVPDESFVQNHFAGFGLAYHHNLIYVHWPEKRSYSPMLIDEKVFVELISGPHLFARKFDAAMTAKAGRLLELNAVSDESGSWQ